MNFSTIEQVIRIGMYAAGGYVFGEAVADGEMFQQAIGGAVAVGAFVWWVVFEYQRPK